MKAILDAKEFKRLIDNTKKFTRWEDGNNKMMQYIHVVIDAKSMEIKAEALDGYRISIEYGKLWMLMNPFHATSLRKSR